MTFTEKTVGFFLAGVLCLWLAFLFCIIPGAFRRDNDDINGEDSE
jgi:hypothetical protein